MTEATLTIRRARPGDLDAINIVEAGSTPGLRYVARVFDDFVSDEIGEFSVAEIDRQIVACGKTEKNVAISLCTTARSDS